MSIVNLRIQNKHDTPEKWAVVENIFKPLNGEIIIYDGNPPRIKVGDGVTPLANLPFVISNDSELTDIVNTHINDNTIHITEEERIKWNNKVSCSVEQETAKFNI